MVRFPSRKPHHCLLLTNTNSTVPPYADEFVFVKYPYLLSKSTQRVEVFRHAGSGFRNGNRSVVVRNKNIFFYIFFSFTANLPYQSANVHKGSSLIKFFHIITLMVSPAFRSSGTSQVNLPPAKTASTVFTSIISLPE